MRGRFSLAVIGRFACDARGVAVVEFAFVAPILIFFYFGMAETCQLLMAQRRVSHAAAAISDLVAQGTEIQAEELKQLYEAGCTIVRPFPVHRVRIRVTSVVRNAAGETEVAWSENNNRGFTDPTDGDPMAVETPLDSEDDGVVVAEVEYDHFSPIGHFLPGATELTHKAEMRPRRSQNVAFKTGGATTTTTKLCYG